MGLFFILMKGVGKLTKEMWFSTMSILRLMFGNTTTDYRSKPLFFVRLGILMFRQSSFLTTNIIG